jgi:hypothetical protein
MVLAGGDLERWRAMVSARERSDYGRLNGVNDKIRFWLVIHVLNAGKAWLHSENLHFKPFLTAYIYT